MSTDYAQTRDAQIAAAQTAIDRARKALVLAAAGDPLLARLGLRQLAAMLGGEVEECKAQCQRSYGGER